MRLWICCLAVFLIELDSCSPVNEEHSPFDQIADQQARAIVRKAMQVSGGYENWLAIDSMSYIKRSILYHADSSITSDVLQQHFYRFHPVFEAEISWLEDSLDRRLLFMSEKVEMYHGDSLVAVNNASHRKSVMSALYVLAQPYKLLDAGTQLTYEGPINLPNSKSAHVIRASYNPDAYDNHSTKDLWWYYFDVNTGSFLGSMVHHPPTYAWIENVTFVKHTPVQFHANRNSYRVDSLMQVQYLRAAFEYRDYQVWD